MSGPSITARLPPLDLFRFPPPPGPQPLPPPQSVGSIAAPFTIPPDLYLELLSPKWPITIATVYSLTALYVNGVNSRRGFKPWWISTTRLFYVFVVLHNVFLAVYSAFTFIAMLRALRHSWPSLREYEFLGVVWPGLRTQNGIAGAVDALCKIHGPRGFGSAVYYNVTSSGWESKDPAVRLWEAVPGVKTPDSTDVGRLWNEGLAFWGWWFYLSKFYEVVDTAIILAKGKRSSTLQTYHHAGAMFCMWAGIRYMSPPIWMFVFINSGIHALMYTYYTLSALRIPVRQSLKRTLTTMQICQFLIGFTFAACHLFVIYTVPVSTPYRIVKAAVSSAITAAANAVTLEASALSSAASAVASSPAIIQWLQKEALRAIGEVGGAKNVEGESTVSPVPIEIPVQSIKESPNRKVETRFRNVYKPIECIDTAGESFAVWLNLIYLLPLTVRFVRFFFRSYIRRTAVARQSKDKEGVESHSRRLSRSVEEAVEGVDRELNRLGEAAEEGVMEVAEMVTEKARTASPASVREKGRRVSETVEKFEQRMREEMQSTPEKVNGATRALRERASQNLRQVAEHTEGSAQHQKEETDSENKPKTENEEKVEAETETERGVTSSSLLTPSASAYGTFGESEIREAKGPVSEGKEMAPLEDKAEAPEEIPQRPVVPERSSSVRSERSKSGSHHNKKKERETSPTKTPLLQESEMRNPDLKHPSKTRIPSPIKKPFLAKSRPRTPSPTPPTASPPTDTTRPETPVEQTPNHPNRNSVTSQSSSLSQLDGTSEAALSRSPSQSTRSTTPSTPESGRSSRRESLKRSFSLRMKRGWKKEGKDPDP